MGQAEACRFNQWSGGLKSSLIFGHVVFCWLCKKELTHFVKLFFNLNTCFSLVVQVF